MSASHASCRSISHGWRSTKRSVSAQTIVSAYVTPISAKNGLIWNHASAGLCSVRYWTRIADPSTKVMAAARPPISQRSFRRSTVVGKGLGELADQVEDRHVHRNDDAADDSAEDGNHDRLHQRQQAGHRGVHLFFIEV